ncbi:MAG: PEP-CTERM sorting domain-containing protein [Verrucomicrobiota bacterium]
MRTSLAGLLVAGFSVTLPSVASAQTTWTWNGADGEYTVGSNWDQGTRPDLTATGNTAIINSGAVTYTPGGDLAINNGGSLVINGGSWTQVDSVAWIQLGGGSLVVAGGTFNQGTAGNIVRNADTSITISSGVANFSGNLINDTATLGSLNLSGTGTIGVQNEFKPIETFTVSGGTLTVGNLISFADGPGGIDFAAGTINLDGSGGNSGFYGGGLGKGLNFVTGSTGTLFFSSYSATELNADGFLTNGTIQSNGAIDAAGFNIVEADGGVYVSLIGAAIPEPSAFAMLAGVAALGFVASRRRRD